MSVELRPARPTDRAAMLEITKDVWDGQDYLPRVFDAWVSDPGATFQAAEVEGEVAGFQRLRPVSREVIFYEGLRVGARFRRQGLARQMLAAAVHQARSLGFSLVRLSSSNPDAIALFTSAGFELELDTRFGFAKPIEGADPPPLGRAADAERLFRALAADAGYAAYHGSFCDGAMLLPLDAAALARQCDLGHVRVGAGGRALVIVRPWPNDSELWVGFIAGSGAALRDLLLALRSEADLTGRELVGVFFPTDHPAREDLEQSGYDFDADAGFLAHYVLRL